MRSNSRFQNLAIVAAAIVVVGVVSWATISSITAAGAPSGFAATAGDSQVTLTWNNPNDTTITGYQVLQVAIDKLVVPSTETGAIGAGDRFGDSVGIAGNRAVVGAPLQESLDNQSVSITNGGWGHTFSRGSGGWSYDEFLAVSNPQVEGRLGSSVAVAGSTVMAGAPSYNQNNNTDPGEVTIASKSSPTSSWATEFTKTGQFGNDLFGRSVALDTGIAVVGAPGAMVGSDALAGKAYLYTKNNNVWGPAATAIWSAGTNAGAGTVFGSSVAVDGNTVVIGSPGEDSYSGAAYVFTENNNMWSAVRLTASDRANADSFGRWVAVDGNFVVVGSWRDDDGGTDSGSVYVFTKPSGGWGTWVTLSTTAKAALTAKLTASDAAADDHFGWSVAVDGDNVVVGAYGNDDDGNDSGSVYLFTKPSGGWATATETVKLTAPDAAASDNFGDSVAAGGGRVIVGAPGDESETGAAYVFSIPTWTDISNSDKNTTSHTVTGLDNDVEYTFLIRPVDSGGPGPASGNKHAKPQQSSAATPANLTAAAGVGEVTLYWDDPNDSTITAYKYRQKEGSGSFGSWTNIALTDIDSTSVPGKIRYTVTGLTNGQTYTFRIRAVDEDDDTGNSNDVTVTTILAAPTTLLATVGAGQIGLNWDNPNNTLITKYQYSTNGGTSFNDITGSSATTTAYTVTGLDNGDEYTLAVRAANASVNGEAATVTATPLLPAPTILAATPYSERVVLSWDNLAGVGNYGITTAASGSTPEDSIWSSGSGATTTVELTSLTNNTVYTFTVRAVYVPPGVSSDPPKTIGMVSTVTATPIPVPAAPANFSATPFDKRIELSWGDPGNTPITKYELLQLAEESGLIASDAAKNDRFGVSVAVDDDTAVVGAFQPTYTDPDTSLDVSRPGAAYVYTKDSNGAWSQQAKLTASDGAGGDEFGIAVAVDGDTVVVGARGDETDQGAIYVFTKPSDGDWTSTITETKLTATGGAADDLFGASVALYGGTIVVGALGDQNSVGGTDVSTGSAYVFTRNSETGEWSQNAKLTASNAGADDLFGNSVAVDDDTIAVGAYGKDGNSLTDSGLVYVFVKSGGAAWATTTETVQLRASDRDANDNFGRSVAVDTDTGTGTIVVGASGDRNTVGGTEVGTGSTYVFTEPNTGWANSGGTETAKLTASDGAHSDQFGRSVAVDGDTIVVGAHQNDDDGTDSGSIYVFVMPTNGWTDITGTVKLTASDAATGDRFGIALALDGDTALVAAPRNDANDDDDTGNDVLDAGSAYVFDIKGWDDIDDDAAQNRSHTVTGLTNDITYTFAVRAVNPSGDGPAATDTATPVPVPAAPVNLSATPGDGEVALSWYDPGNATITKYQYSTDGGANFSDFDGGSNSTTTSYTITGLDNSTEYTLALRAVNPTGNGEASTVTALILPAKPTGLTGIEYNSQVELGWDDPDDSTITKYQLLRITPRKLTAEGAGRDDDFFGMAVAADGDTALVGALQAYDADFNRPGAAYVFTWNSVSEVWTKNATLNASDGDNGDGFGRSVALDGDTAVVGAYQYDEGEPGEGQATNTGSAYIFTKDSQGMWKQTAQLTASDAADGDQFGYSVALDGDTIVVGAHLDDDDDGAESGSVYVFTKPSGDNGWDDWNSLSADGKAMLTTKLTAPGTAAGGYFGNSVAIDGNTIVVGARNADSAYAITKPSSDTNSDGSIDWEDWDSLDADGKATLTATLTAFDAAAGDEFGISVAIDGNTVVVGAHQHDQSDTVNNSGAVYVFTKPGNAWATGTETAKLTASDGTSGDEFGISVAVSGNTIVIGAHLDDDKGDKSGSAYFFTKPINGNWATGTETAKIIDHDGAAEDHFGWSVAVDGSTAVVGAYGDGSNKGAAHIMGIPSWTDISNSAPGEANATSYAVTGLTNDVMYTFQLRGLNVSGHSPASDTLDATPKTVPHAPDNLSAAGGDGQVALSWDDPEDDTITGYQYQQAEGEGEFVDWADISGSMATTTSHTVTGLTNGTSYTFAVRAVNDSLGNGAASTVYVVMVPAAPTNLSAAPDDGKVVLSWADPGNATITKYQYSTDGGENFSDFDGGRNSDTTANTVTGLTNYQEYWFQIRAVNETGEGPASNSASATPRLPKPGKPANLTAEAGDQEVMLQWANPGNSTIDKYQISEVIEEGFLTASDGATGDHFGVSVAIDGDTAVVGADRLNARKGAAYIFTRDSNGAWTQQAKLDGEFAGDQFGWSVAVEGDTVVVGAHAYDGEDDDDETLVNSGAVYVYTKPATDGGWVDTIIAPAKLTPTVPEEYAFFGGSVALAGNTLAIGSRLYDAGGRLGAGAAYVFTKDSGTGVWSQAAKLTASTSLQLAYLGYSLAVDGDTVLVGAYGDDTVFGELGSGSAYLFVKPDSVDGWADDDYNGNETAKLTAPDRQPSGYFGFSVALDGDTAVIGASQHSDPEIGAGSGAAYVFTKQSGVWGEKAKLTPSDATAKDNFGVSVAVDGDTVVVGSWQDDDNGRNSGSAYVFTKPDLGWASTVETLKLTAPNGAVNDRFGWSVAVDLDDQRGDLALVGAYSDDIATGIDAGSVHVLGIPNWVDIDDSDDATTSHTVAKELDDPDTDLSNGDEYTFQVRALNRSGAGPASDGASATPLGVPAVPVLTASAGDGQVTLSWTKHVPTDPITIAPITGYKLSKNDGATFADIDNSDSDDSDATDLAYTVTGLDNGTTYDFQILVVNSIGETASDVFSAKPASATPEIPTGLEATAGDTQVRLTWGDPDDSSIDKYEFRWKEGTQATVFIDNVDNVDQWRDVPNSNATTTRFMVTGLDNGTSYAFQIRAVDDGADPKDSLPAQIDATPTSMPPAPPTGLMADPDDSRVTLTWDNPDDSTIDRYEYRQKVEDPDNPNEFGEWTSITSSGPTTTEYTVTLLTNGTEYTFEVRAVDVHNGNEDVGEPSADRATPLPPVPGKPTNLSVTGRNQEVTLTWRAPLTSVVDKYEVLHLQASELAPLNVVDNDKFGYSVAVDGDIAVVGAYRDGEKGDEAGAAYVFTRSGGVVWDEGVKLTASDGAPYDNFGISVAVDGETIVIGASGDDDNGADSGSVYVFTKANGVWSQVAKLTASDGAALDYFGHSVTVSGDTVLVGAYQDDREETVTETALEDSGSVYVFTKPTSEGGWSDWNDLPQTATNENDDDKDRLTARLSASDAADDDNFGTSVALDGDTAVIGAPGDDDNGIDSGSVYVFTKPSKGWGDWKNLPQTISDPTVEDKDALTAKLTANDVQPGDSFGVSVTVDNVTVAVGAYQHDPIALDSDPNSPSYLPDAGAAYVFTKTAGTWNQSAKLTADDRAPGDYFGYSVAVDDGTVLVGAYQDDDKGIDSGSAYVFTRDSNVWRHTNKLTEDPGEAGGWFGYSVDTVADTALVGAGSAHVMDIHDWEEVYADWEEVSANGPVITHTIMGLTNNREYEFEVRAVNLAGVGNPVAQEATPHVNRPPVANDDNVTTAEDSAVVIRVLENDTDVDGDTLSVTAVSTPSNGGAAVTDNGTTVTYTPKANFRGSDSFDYGVSDGNEGTDTGRVNVTVQETVRVTPQPINYWPFFTEGNHTTRTVPEDAALGTEVGGPLIATDRDFDRLQYSLSGHGRWSFYVDVGTGQLITAVLLDYESQSEYSVQVTVDDSNGGLDVTNVTIAVLDVAEPPSQPGAPVVGSSGPTGLAVSWTAPDNKGPEITDYDVRYQETRRGFQDAGFVGAGTSTTLGNLKPGASYEVQVRAINPEGASPWSAPGRGETGEASPTTGPTPEPTVTPTPEPTITPTPEPTVTPTPGPTVTPTPAATVASTPEPAVTPTPEPAVTPTTAATVSPTTEPTVAPTTEPTVTPTPAAMVTPTPAAMVAPTTEPTATPEPTVEPVSPEWWGREFRGFPWWIIVAIAIGVVTGIVAGVLFIVWVRRRRR